MWDSLTTEYKSRLVIGVLIFLLNTAFFIRGMIVYGRTKEALQLRLGICALLIGVILLLGAIFRWW